MDFPSTRPCVNCWVSIPGSSVSALRGRAPAPRVLVGPARTHGHQRQEGKRNEVQKYLAAKLGPGLTVTAEDVTKALDEAAKKTISELDGIDFEAAWFQ